MVPFERPDVVTATQKGGELEAKHEVRFLDQT